MELEGIEPSSAEWSTSAIRPFPGQGLTAALPPDRRSVMLTAGSFPEVSGLSHRQRSFPAVLHRFCCRAAVDWPRVSSRIAGTLYFLTRSGGESEVAIGASLVPCLRSLSNSGRTAASRSQRRNRSAPDDHVLSSGPLTLRPPGEDGAGVSVGGLGPWPGRLRVRRLGGRCPGACPLWPCLWPRRARAWPDRP